jgi:hypothetical protein
MNPEINLPGEPCLKCQFGKIYRFAEKQGCKQNVKFKMFACETEAVNWLKGTVILIIVLRQLDNRVQTFLKVLTERSSRSCLLLHSHCPDLMDD